MLDRFQRQTVEAVREHRGRISITLDGGDTTLTTAIPDKRLSHDIAIALQAHFDRINNK